MSFQLRADQSAGTTRIEGLEIEDADVANFFSDMDEDEREEKVRTALKMGVIALRSSDTARQVDFVEKRFEQIRNKFEDEMEEYFDQENGHIPNVMDELLDPHSDGTPINELKSDIRDLRDEVVIEDTMSEKAGQYKGEKFEDILEELLREIARTRDGDGIRRTGTEEGSIADCKKGDFVIEPGYAPGKVVVEAKDTKKSFNKIRDELDTAIENRNAEYGIHVAKTTDNVPVSKVGWFSEHDGDKLVIVLSDDEIDEMSERILEIAYQWAVRRTREMEDTIGGEVDSKDVKRMVESLVGEINSFRDIREACTKIEDRSQEIRGQLDEIEENVEKSEEEILEEIQMDHEN